MTAALSEAATVFATGLSPRLRGERWRSRIGGIFLFLILALPCQARPQVLVVIADHLTLDDVTRPGLPNLAQMRAQGRTALMSPGLAAGKDPIANAYASLGAGDSVGVGDVSQGRLAQALADAKTRTALIGDADGDDTGAYRPASLILPAPSEASVGQDDGTVADPVAAGGRRIDPSRLWALTQNALRDCDLVVVHDGDFSRIEREDQQGNLLPQAYQLHRQQARQSLDNFLGQALASRPSSYVRWLYLVVPTPPLTRTGGWDSLTPFLCVQVNGAGPTGREALRSETTQTDGLIAARDIAPTLLAALIVPVPMQMTGAAAQPASCGLPRLRRLDRQTRLNQQAQNPLFWSLGFLGAALLFGTLGLYLSGRMTVSAWWRRASLYAIRLLSAWPLALLAAPLPQPPTLGVYFAWIVGATLLLALLPSPSLIFGLTALVLVGDGLTGTALVSQSVLSAYFLSGIRFYGIGNEYMGVLIGGALLLASLRRVGARGAAFWFALVTFALSFPAFGAKAGGAVTAAATFVVAWRLLQKRPVTWKHLAGGLIAGFALVFVWALVGHWLPVRRTHIETAVGALGQGRLGYIAGVAWRKVGLAVRVFLHPGTLLGVLGLILVSLCARLFLRRQVRDYLARHGRFAAVWHAGLWGCLVAVLFNDSGVVAAILVFSSLLLALLHGLYEEVCVLSPSMSVRPASASPSAMP